VCLLDTSKLLFLCSLQLTLIISAIRKHLAEESNNKAEVQRSLSLNDKDLISTHIARVDIKPDHLAVQLFVKPDQQGGKRDQPLSRKGGARDHANPNIMVVPWRKMPSKRPREIILPAGTSSHLESRPIRAETRVRLVKAIAKGRRWLDELMAGTATNVEQIARTENCTIRQINMTISLAFLTPNLVQAAVDGRLHRGVGIANLRDAPAEWSLQYARLGLAS
jgi:site-specific DNA recombinase